MSNSPLIFKDYIVTETYLKTNLKFKQENMRKVSITQDFSADIAYDMNGVSYVQLNLEIKNEKDESPFDLSVSIVGFFELNSEEYEEEDYINLLKVNAVAILYPYLRSIVTDVTSKANAFNPLILPPMNIASMLKEEKKIKVTKVPIDN
ncbi:protein-export chaperone SecB [Mammaliicoccus sciuri]|uniref:protein-export chaperone SecB n=1 Tax=Mammaliicoccus sciuri TaxID=1296 RepID=UPI002DBE6075|nr:protein-export chaperone SecB [Mammaliicoccus sciuri]MEB8263395.1 protein-export chaperone SecB [Mammaliicoccus sciuri]